MRAEQSLTCCQDHIAKRGFQVLDDEGQNVTNSEIACALALTSTCVAGYQLREVELPLVDARNRLVADVHPDKFRV